RQAGRSEARPLDQRDGAGKPGEVRRGGEIGVTGKSPKSGPGADDEECALSDLRDGDAGSGGRMARLPVLLGEVPEDRPGPLAGRAVHDPGRRPGEVRGPGAV